MSRARTALRRTSKTLLWVVVAAVVVLAAAFGLLQTGAAKAWLADAVEAMASEPGVAELRIGRIEGFLPFEVRVVDLTVADARGVWLRADRARAVPALDRSLLSRPTLEVAEAGTVEILRAPASEGSDAPFVLGDVLVPLRIGALTVDRLMLGEPLAGVAVAAAVAGELDMRPARRYGTARIEATALEPGAGAVSVDATVAGDDLRATVTVSEPDAALLGRLAGQSGLPGYEATVTGEGPIDAWSGRIDAVVRPGPGTAPALAEVLGERATLGAELALRLGERVMLHLANVEASAAPGRLTGGADLDLLAGTISARAATDGAELAPLAPLAGIALEGRATVDARFDGPLETPRLEADLDAGPLTVEGLSADRLRGSVSVDALGDAPSGSVDLAVTAGDLDATVAGAYAVAAEGPVRLTGMTVRDARGGRLDGTVTIDPETTLTTGEITADVPDLAPWSDLVGQPLAGSMRATFTLSGEDGRQALAFEAGADRLRVGLAENAELAAAAVRAQGSLRDVLGRPSGRAELTLSDARLPDVAAERAALTAEGDAGELAYTLSAAGTAREPFELDGAGTLSAAWPAWRTRIDRLDGAWAGYPLRLDAPATVRGDGAGSIAVEGVALALADGTLTLDGRLTPDALAVEADGRDLPASLIALVAEADEIEGRLDAALRLDAAAGRAPDGDFRLAGRELAVPDFGPAPDVTLALDARGRIDGSGVALSGEARSAPFPPLTFEANLQTQTGPRGVPAVGPDTPLRASTNGAVELSQVLPLLPISETVLRGTVELAVQAEGAVAAPRLSGRATMEDGYYESLDTGAVLRDIALTADLEGDTVRIARFQANDGAGGGIEAQGTLPVLTEDRSGLAVDVAVRGFRVVRLDIATARLTGDLALRGAGDGLALDGALTLDEGEINIPRRLPEGATVAASLDTSRITVETPGRRTQGLDRPDDAADTLPLALDVAVDVPGRLFVRGRGLESEWAGTLRAAGTIDDPRLNGELHVRRGTFDALGRTFDIENGSLLFLGPPGEPEINFTAEAARDTLTAIVNVRGRPTALAIDLSSRPELPTDEILSRLYFGKSAGQLSPAQALQLAEAAAALGSDFQGTGGITDKVRDALGIDVLTFEGGEGDGVSGSKMRVGKYLAEDLFLRFDQGLTPESSSMGLEYEVFDNITVEGDVSEAGRDPGAGINFKLDY